MMFRAVLPTVGLDDSLVPDAGVQVGYQGDMPGKLFGYRVTSPGLMTVTAMQPFDQPQLCLPAGQRKQRLKRLFADWPQPVQLLIDALQERAIFENNIEDIDLLQCWSQGSVLLIGDAAHAMTPGLGQGANMGIEDAVELAAVVEQLLLTGRLKDPAAVAEAATTYWQGRLPRVSRVHARSRMMTQENNVRPSNGKAPYFSESMAEFSQWLYNWKPSSVQGVA
eukprot:TRINITY_DN6079_c0_g1_i1.p1 TRINITY_DN6079_c0_g1~~TRINITY_DN6079_c0_g1_i1.p1  ORF type:complete len:223 (+),score=51.60 TRINITY_DN6079_c0_g1_i1:107-775(+)